MRAFSPPNCALSTVESVGNLLSWATAELREAGVACPEREAFHLLQHASGFSQAHLIAFPETRLSLPQMEVFQNVVLRRAERIPLAYLTGRVAFLRWEFLVDERVMVPRPETEFLVEAVARHLKAWEAGWLVDIGTGSGVIGICLALMLPRFQVLALDATLASLEVAKENIALHRCEARVFPVCGAFLTPLKAKVAGIVANLPYIPTAVLPTLEPEVAKYEPHEALDGGENGLRLLLPFAEKAPDYLEAGGMVAMEVGKGQAGQLQAVLMRHPRIKRTEVIPDYAGIDRVVIGFADPQC